MERKTRRLLGMIGMLVGTTSLLLGLTPSQAGADHANDSNPKTTELKDQHRWTRFDNPSFDDADCGGLNPANGPVWHFIANQLPAGTQTVSFTASFGPTNGGAATETIPDVVSARKENNSTFHYYVQGNTQPYLVNAVATFNIDQPADNVLVLSHICGGTTTTTTHPTTTTTTAPTTTTTAPTTTTTAPTTTTTAPTTTTVTHPTTTTTVTHPTSTTTVTHPTTTTTVTHRTTTTAAPTTTTPFVIVTTTTTTAPTTTTQGALVLPSVIEQTSTTGAVAGVSATSAPTEVRGSVLARTGSDTKPLLLAAGFFLLVGGTVLYGSSRFSRA